MSVSEKKNELFLNRFLHWNQRNSIFSKYKGELIFSQNPKECDKIDIDRVISQKLSISRVCDNGHLCMHLRKKKERRSYLFCLH